MIYPTNDYRDYLEHSARGQTWKNHKYIAIRNGRYIYPNDVKPKSLLGRVSNAFYELEARQVKRQMDSITRERNNPNTSKRNSNVSKVSASVGSLNQNRKRKKNKNSILGKISNALYELEARQIDKQMDSITKKRYKSKQLTKKRNNASKKTNYSNRRASVYRDPYVDVKERAKRFS